MHLHRRVRLALRPDGSGPKLAGRAVVDRGGRCRRVGRCIRGRGGRSRGLCFDWRRC
jgi:hypothetical protein